MSPTIYLNSVSYMMPVLVCSAGSPRVWAFLPPALSASSLSTGWKQNLSYQSHSMEQFQDPSILPAQCWGLGTPTPQRGHRLTGKNHQFSGMLTCLVSTFKRSSKKLILKDLATKMMWSPLLPTFPYCLVSQTLGSTTVKTVQTAQRDHSFLLLVQ